MTVGMRDFVPELGRQPLLFRETFRSRADVERNGATLVGTGTTFSDGLVLNGNGNLLYNVSGAEIFRAGITIKTEFTLGFAPNDGAEHYFYRASTATGTAHFSILKNAANLLVVYCNDVFATVAYATWSAALVAGKNTLEVSTTSGGWTIWLNGTQIGTSVAVWALTSPVSTVLAIGSSYNNTSRFVGTIHRFEIYGSTSTSVDEPHLRAGNVVEDIDLSRALAYLPGKSYYKRASDSKYVTAVGGKSGITEALMGSDGTTTAQFPSIIRPRGFSFEGGDQINLGDSDQFSFTDGVNDLPFSVACIVAFNPITTTRPVFGKGSVFAAAEYVLRTSSTKYTYFYLIDSSTGGYIARRTDIIASIDRGSHVIATTYNGTRSTAGIRIYVDGVRADVADNTSGVYGGMKNTADPLLLGRGAGDGFAGNIILPVIDNVEWSPLQVKAITARLLRLARTP